MFISAIYYTLYALIDYMSPRQNLHYAAAVLHVCGVIASVFGLCYIDGRYYPTAYVLHTDWLHSSGERKCTTLDDNGGCTAFTSIAKHHVQLNVIVALLIFFLVSAVAEFIYAKANVKPNTPWRWLEYAISASTQFAVIQLLSNVSSLETVLLGCGLVAFLQLIGYGLELLLQFTPKNYAHVQTAPVVKAPPRTHPQIVLLTSGFAVLIAAWIAPVYHFSRADPPTFVYIIFYGSIVSWLAFGLVMTLRVVGYMSDGNTDLAYTVLSVVSKFTVGITYLAGAWMRNGTLNMAVKCDP